METIQYVQSKLCSVRGICNWATGRKQDESNRRPSARKEARTKCKEDISAVLGKKNLQFVAI